MPKILKPASSCQQLKNLTFKTTPELYKRLASLAERAKASGLTLDLNRELSNALARIVKAGEAELFQVDNKKAGGEENGA